MNFIESFYDWQSFRCILFLVLLLIMIIPQSTNWLQAYYWLGGLSIIAFMLLWSSSLDESAAKPEPKTILNGTVKCLMLFAKPIGDCFYFCILYVLIEQSIQNFCQHLIKVLLLLATLNIQMEVYSRFYSYWAFLAGIIMKK